MKHGREDYDPKNWKTYGEKYGEKMGYIYHLNLMDIRPMFVGEKIFGLRIYKYGTWTTAVTQFGASSCEVIRTEREAEREANRQKALFGEESG